MESRILFFGMIFFMGIYVGFAQGNITKNEKTSSLLKEGKQALIEKDYSKAIKKLSIAEGQAEIENASQSLWRIKNFLGQSYNGLGVKSRALTELTEAVELLNKNPKLEKNKPVVFNNLASLFLDEKDFDNALFYIDKGLKIIKKYPKDEDLKVIGYYLILNKALLYNKSEAYKKASNTLTKINDSLLRCYPMIIQARNLTESQNLFLSGKIKRAKITTEKLLAHSQKKDPYFAEILELLGKINYKEKSYARAISLLNRSLSQTRDWDQKAERYGLMAAIYGAMKNFPFEIHYKDSVIISKDSLLLLTSSSLTRNTRIQLNVEKYKNQLAVDKERQKGQRLLFWIVTLGMILLLATIYFWLKNRLTKQRQEKIIIENKEKLTQLALAEKKKDFIIVQNQLAVQQEKASSRQAHLKNKIAHKNRKLATKALFLTERNQLIKEVIETLSGIKEVNRHKKIQYLIQSFKKELKIKEEWEDYVKLFEEINPNFFKEIKKRHSSLTGSDLRYLSYLYMNFTTQEIANVMVITLEASRKRKQRIAQKMNIKTDELVEYLYKLVSTPPL